MGTILQKPVTQGIENLATLVLLYLVLPDSQHNVPGLRWDRSNPVAGFHTLQQNYYHPNLAYNI